MSRLTGTLGHALLGVLAEGPRTGYALVKHLEQSIAYTWPASHSQVYPELARLREAGLIAAPIAYTVDGRQYIAVTTGLGGGSPRMVPRTISPEIKHPANGHALYVFELPR